MYAHASLGPHHTLQLQAPDNVFGRPLSHRFLHWREKRKTFLIPLSVYSPYTFVTTTYCSTMYCTCIRAPLFCPTANKCPRVAPLSSVSGSRAFFCSRIGIDYYHILDPRGARMNNTRRQREERDRGRGDKRRNRD